MLILRVIEEFIGDEEMARYVRIARQRHPDAFAPMHDVSGADHEKQLNAKCGACDCVFLVAYLPMDLEKAAQLMKRAACPSCGETKRIFVASSPPVDKSNSGEN